MGKHVKLVRKPQWVLTDSGAVGITPAQICVGIDPSLSGHAIAVLCDGELQFASGWTDKKTLQKKNPHTLNWLKLPPKAREADRQKRLCVLTNWTRQIINSVMCGANSVHVAIEGYAYSKRGKGLHGVHGLVEWIKQLLWIRGVPFRVYDPLSVKLAWTGKGTADKAEMQEVCADYFGTAFEKEGAAGENLADAVLIAGLLHKELEIREGRLLLENIDEDTRRVMLRTTKSEPEAIITRNFVTAGASVVTDPIYSKLTLEASRFDVMNLGELR